MLQKLQHVTTCYKSFVTFAMPVNKHWVSFFYACIYKKLQNYNNIQSPNNVDIYCYHRYTTNINPISKRDPTLTVVVDPGAEELLKQAKELMALIE